MTNDFSFWLAQNGLSEILTTAAGDSMYVNREKLFGVIRKRGEYAAHSFYLDDIVECKTYDDENLIVEWSKTTPWTLSERSIRYSTSQVFMKIRFRNNQILKLQIFLGTEGNIKRNTEKHIALLNYACQVSQIIYSHVAGL